MSQDDIPNDTFSIHRRTWELIPWVVNGSASEEDGRSVERHLLDCADCREEYAFQQQLHRAMGRDSRADAQLAAQADAAASLRRLWQRIDGDREAAAQPPRRRGSGWLLRGLAAAVLIEGVAIAALGASQWSQPPLAAPGQYRVLSTPTRGAPRATIRAVLAPDLTLGALQTLLGQTQLQIVGGPSEAGVYSLAPLSAAGAASTQTALAQLRSQASVRFAEPLDAVLPAP